MPDGWSIKSERDLIHEGKAPKIIYVVFGEHGEYEDYEKWQVCCFDNAHQAVNYSIYLQLISIENDKKRNNINLNDKIENKGDPFCPDWYHNVKYGFEKILLMSSYDEITKWDLKAIGVIEYAEDMMEEDIDLDIIKQTVEKLMTGCQHGGGA